jgi:TetR/AcrR family transcriptional repressor for divergent bdcA
MARTGRPREFDKDAAIGQAMSLFWDHGYEATSLAQLKAAMGGISTASFYAAFGSKEALFRTVLDRYLDTHGRVMAVLRDGSLAPRQAIECALRESARMQTNSEHPAGCMIVLATATTAPENRHLQTLLKEERNRNRAALRALVDRAVASGEFPDSIAAGAVAAMYDTFLVGLATQARDGVPFATLDAAVTEIMGVWDRYATVGSAGMASTGAKIRARR